MSACGEGRGEGCVCVWGGEGGGVCVCVGFGGRGVYVCERRRVSVYTMYVCVVVVGWGSGRTFKEECVYVYTLRTFRGSVDDRNNLHDQEEILIHFIYFNSQKK